MLFTKYYGPVGYTEPDSNPTPAPKVDPPRPRPPWKVIILFLPGGSKLPGPPDGKNWLDVLLLLLKVAAAGVALWKAVAAVV